MDNSIKPAKPRKDFPLFAHGSGMWAKKIRKRTVYFTSWRLDPTGEAALGQFEREWPYLRKGQVPPPIDVSGGCKLKDLVNNFLEAKEDMTRDKELSPRTFMQYYRACESLINHFGRDRLITDLRPHDFSAYRKVLAKRHGVVGLKNAINCVCILFNYAHESNLLDKPMHYGQGFAKPSELTVRRDRNEAGPKLFERDEVLRILQAADVQLRAMMMLGINCGFGNTDCATLPRAALDLETGWVTHARPKTEIQRRAPLWPETVDAIKAWLVIRAEPADDAYKPLVFLTRLAQPWVRVASKVVTENGKEKNTFIATDAISGQFGKLLKQLEINGRRGLGFYTLRHCFETFAGESKDQVAVDAIMGHVDSSIAANYRHRISDERLLAVAGVVRAWLFGAEGGAA